MNEWCLSSLWIGVDTYILVSITDKKQRTQQSKDLKKVLYEFSWQMKMKVFLWHFKNVFINNFEIVIIADSWNVIKMQYQLFVSMSVGASKTKI